MIRPFTIRDLNAVLDIWLNTMIEAHPFLPATYFLNQYESFQKDHLLKSQSLVYEIDGKIVGFISVKQDMTISALSVLPQYRNNGFGEALFNKLIEHYQLLHIRVFAENKLGVSFLEKNGFEIAMREKVDHHDVLIMSCDNHKRLRRS